MNSWFTNKDFSKLEIIKFKSISEHEKIEVKLIIEDIDAIKDLVARFEQINSNGDEMIKPGPSAGFTTLNFYSGSEREIIEMLNGMIKTPSTGFNSQVSDIEKDLVVDIKSLLQPELNKAILKIKNLELKFAKFSVTYRGFENSNEKSASLSLHKDFFELKDSKNHIEKVEITSGQLPPAPFEIKLDKQKLKILTYQTKDNLRLYPKYFQIL